jgi:hypothetical protein
VELMAGERLRHDVWTTVRLTRDERTWLKEMARLDGVPMATLIREAVAVYVGDFVENAEPPWAKRGVGMVNSPKA